MFFVLEECFGSVGRPLDGTLAGSMVEAIGGRDMLKETTVRYQETVLRLSFGLMIVRMSGRESGACRGV